MTHESHGLAGVHTFGDRNLMGVLFDQIGDPVKDALPVDATHCAPHAKTLRCRFCRSIDIGSITRRNVAKMATIDW